MKRHNGMRPQDVVILLKIVALNGSKSEWLCTDLAYALKISTSEISEALNRCKIAGLIDSKKRSVMVNSFYEFLVYGLKYVFPVEPGAVVRGVPTAHSAPPIKERVVAGSDIYVWPYARGSLRGQAIRPLYNTVPLIVEKDVQLYELLALTDTIRVGRVREVELAIVELKERLNNGHIS